MANEPNGRGKRYSDKQVREFELAGGVEGGMPVGSAGGPGQERASKPGKSAHRTKSKPE